MKTPQIKKLLCVFLVITISGILFSCKKKIDDASVKVIKIGLSLGITGKYSKNGVMCKNAYSLWEKNINNKGGILNKKVEVIIYDDKSDVKEVEKIYEKLITVDKVNFLMAPYSSKLTLAAAAIADKHDYPIISPGGSSDSIWKKGYKGVFGILVPASKYSIVLMEMLIEKGIDSYKNLAIISADDAFAKSISKGSKKWAERFGFNIVSNQTFKKGNRDLKQYAENIKKSKADVIILCGHYNESVDMRKALKAVKWFPKIFYATVGPANTNFQKELKGDSERVFSSSLFECNDMLKLNKMKDFCKVFKETYNTVPSYQGAAAYSGMQVLQMAITRAETLDKDKVKEILFEIDTTDIVMGRYGVDKSGMQTKNFFLLVQWQNGKKEIVWPSNLKTSSPKI